MKLVKDLVEGCVEVLTLLCSPSTPSTRLVSPAQESGGSPCPSSCPDLNKSQTLGSLSESGAVLVEVCCLLVLAVENKVPHLSIDTLSSFPLL